jgi:hypothetical protein
MEWTSRTILILLTVLFAGYGIGLLEGRIRWYNKRHKQEKSEPQPGPPEPHPGEANLLGLWLDANQHLRLDLDGQRLKAPLLSSKQRQRLIDLLLVMRPWVESDAPTAQGAPQSKSPANPPELQPPSALAQASAPTHIPIASIAPAGDDELPSVGTSLVAQIDAILQAHLAGTPLSERGIHLQESPQGGVIVYVGTDRYQSVEAVPDPEIQAAIRAAIKEWED